MSWLRKTTWLTAIFVLLPACLNAQKKQAATTPTEKAPIDKLVDRITTREHQEVSIIRKYKPIIETYIQDVRLDKNLGPVPVKDHYFIGIADLSKGVVLRTMEKEKEQPSKIKNPLDLLAGSLSPTYVPEGFLEMIFVDPRGFDRRHYVFEYLKREFLGDVRCLVFDVTPAKDSGNGRFKGRMWVEDQDYTIVRFSGVFEPEVRQFGFYLHFDSWRENAGPGLWLPAYIYNGETDLSHMTIGHIHERSQTRLWGYRPQKEIMQEEFTEMKVESPNATEQADPGPDSSPLEQQRNFEEQGEQRVVEKLERAHLIAPPSEVDKMLGTVVNNIEASNNLVMQPDVKCRVLVTSTLEASSIGHTILVSRGLLDVLPDEASLAAMLAHEMAHIQLGRSAVPTWAFADQMLFPDEESLRKFSFYMNEDDEAAASTKALEWMQKSPYKDKLPSAGLFIRQLDAYSKALTVLISPHLRDPAFLNCELAKMAPALEPANLEQVPALPLGSRIKLEPWNGRIELLKQKPLQLASLAEKMPLGLAPFYPYLTRRTTADSP